MQMYKEHDKAWIIAGDVKLVPVTCLAQHGPVSHLHGLISQH
jgi:hypothetical protein